jgi:hypothetical protein
MARLLIGGKQLKVARESYQIMHERDAEHIPHSLVSDGIALSCR